MESRRETDGATQSDSGSWPPDLIVRTCEAIATGSSKKLGIRPESGDAFTPFEIYDPFGLRRAVVPVFRQTLDGRLYGMGTAFHVDGFANFLTAYHVIDFVEEVKAGRPMILLGMAAMVFGTVGIPEDCFVPAERVIGSFKDDDDPMRALIGASIRRPAIDMASIKLEPVGPGAKWPQSVPVDVNRWVPRVGEWVLAVGFPGLDLSEVDEERQTGLLTEGMFGAFASVVAVHADGVSSSNPTPVIEVKGDWPSGMSGGPVFNMQGNVIGLVSRSLRSDESGVGSGFAAYFKLIRDVEFLAPALDADNPGWRQGWAVFSQGQADPVSVHLTEEDARAVAENGQSVLRIVQQIGSNQFIEKDSGQ